MSLPDPRAALSALLAAGRLVRLPCAYDGLSARIAQQCGFPAVAFSGNAVSASLLGLPDVGVLGASDNIAHAGRIARGLDIPMICDADTGYGGVMNVTHTVREFEAAGVAGIHLEDQVTPKRCGLLPQGIPVVGMDEQVRKIRAAVQARRDPRFLIIARTDAKSMHGLEAAARRARAYVEAGADAALVMGANTPAELRHVADVVRAPLVAVIQESPPTSALTDADLEAAGCVFALHAGVARYAVTRALREAFAALRRDGHTGAVRERMASFEEYNAALGLEAWLELESRLLGDAPAPREGAGGPA
jgi:2-methylisocitrate lyase-like PEP mutase family enzyme